MNLTTSLSSWTEGFNLTYDNDYEPFTFSTTYKAIDLVSSVVCFTTNVFGNALTLAAICKFSSLREKSYTTLAALTIADLLVVIKATIMPIFYSFVLGRKVFLSLLGIVYFITINAGSHMLLLAADRFIAIMWPFYYGSTVTQAKLWLASFAVSIASVGLTVFYMYIFISNSPLTVIYILDICFYSLAAILLLVLQGKITYVARKHKTRIATLETHSTEEPRKLDKASKTMIAVVGVYLLVGLPFVVADIISMSPWANQYYFAVFYLRQYSTMLMTFNSSVNFVIYAALNKRFRYAYKLILTCKVHESKMSSFNTN